MQTHVEAPFLDLAHDLDHVIQILVIDLSTATFDIQSFELTDISNRLTVRRVR